MDMTSEAMKTVLEISKPELHLDILDVHGVKANYSTKTLHQVVAKAPEKPDLVAVQTLAGFADLVRAKLEDKAFAEDYLIHVENESTVTLKARRSDDYGRRQVLIQAKPVPFKQFTFGQWVDQESFAISLAALFTSDGDQEYVLKLAAELVNEATSTSEDNGFTQKALVKAGLRTKAEVIIKPKVALAPYRTFPEVAQPVSDFVFRAKTMGDTPALMLVEADGGRWKVAAIETLRKAMEAFELGIPIIA